MSIFTGRSFLTKDNMSREKTESRFKKQTIKEQGNLREERKGSSLLIYVTALFVIAAVIYGIYYYINFAQKNSFSVVWEKTAESEASAAETFRGFASFKGGIIKYTRDGAEFIDKKGNVVWERSYQMNSPIIDVSSDYAVIADQGASDIYIFNSTELTGASETVLPISLVRIADSGVAYAVLNDSDAEYITAFRADGSAIDLSVKSVINGDGYPFDIDTSPDGTQLIASYVSIKNGQTANEVVFRNFGSVGQNTDARRVVGGFRDEFSGHLAGKVHFSTDAYSQAFYDGGIVFFSTKVLSSPEVLANISFDEEMLAIAYSEDTVAVLLDNSTAAGAGAKSGQTEAENASEGEDENKKTLITAGNSSAPYRLVIFNNKGAVTGEADIDFGYKGLCIGGGCTIVYGANEIRIFGSKGNLRGSLTFEDGEISNITTGSDAGTFYLISGSSIKQVKY